MSTRRTYNVKSPRTSVLKTAAVKSPAPRVSELPSRNVLTNTADKKNCLTAEQKEHTILTYRFKARALGKSLLGKWRVRLDGQELESIVDLSLCEAAKHFNPNRGVAFMTFFYYHLKGNLVRAVTAAANSRLVPLFACDSAGQESGQGEGGVGALENSISQNMLNEMHGEPALAPDEELARKQLVMASRTALLKLDPLEQEVLSRLFQTEELLNDIAENLGYSRCHISRVKRRALEVLNKDLCAKLSISSTGPLIDDEGAVARSAGYARRKLHRRRARAQSPTSAATLPTKLNTAICLS